MAPKHLKPLWHDQFTMQLGKLRSGLGPNIVADVVAAEFEEACDLEPEEAAVSLSVPPWVLHHSHFPEDLALLMTKPTKTASELKRLVTEWVMNTNEFKQALAANPTLSVDVGTPTRHEYNGFSNWEISVVPRAEGYYGLIGAAIIAVGAKYDLGE